MNKIVAYFLIMISLLLTCKSSDTPKKNCSKQSGTSVKNNTSEFINPAANSTNLRDEIAKLQNLFLQVKDNTLLKIRLKFAMGETYVKYGRVNEAIDCFLYVVENNLKEKKSYYYLGELYLAKGDNKKAYKYWKRYLELVPDSYKREEIKKFISSVETQ